MGGWTEGNRGGEITPSARVSAVIALQILQSSRFTISFALASLPPSEKLFPSLHLEYFFSFFQANQGIFLQWELRANDNPFYRNLLHIRKCAACTQAYISKCSSFSIPSPASLAEPPTTSASPDWPLCPFSSCPAQQEGITSPALLTDLL